MKELERIFETKEGFANLEGKEIKASLIKDYDNLPKFRISKERNFSHILDEYRPKNADAYIMDFKDPVPKTEISIKVRIRYYKIRKNGT